MATWRPREDSLAARLTARLVPGAGGEARPELVRAVNAALVVLADHELATSTLAVRMAASTRADLYDAVLAGLAAESSPLSAGSSRLHETQVPRGDLRRGWRGRAG